MLFFVILDGAWFNRPNVGNLARMVTVVWNSFVKGREQQNVKVCKFKNTANGLKMKMHEK